MDLNPIEAVKDGLRVLLVLAALNSCSLNGVAERGAEFPLLLFVTSQLAPRISGNPDALAAIGPSGGTTGSLHTVENYAVNPEASGFLSAPIVADMMRAGPYIAIPLTASINHFGHSCSTILVHRTTLATTCMEQTPGCPGGGSSCPGKAFRANEAGNRIAMIDSSGNVFAIDPGTNPASARILASNATSFTLNQTGSVLVRSGNGTFTIHDWNGTAIQAFQNPAVTCLFGGDGDNFYVQEGADIRRLSSAAPTPQTVWTGAPNFSCGTIAEANGLASIIYDPGTTNDSRLYFALATETGQATLLSYVAPGTRIALNGANGTFAFAGPGTPSYTRPLGRIVGNGSQDQLLVADDLHTFDVSVGGDVYFGASWPLNGTILGFVPAGASSPIYLWQNPEGHIPYIAAVR